MNVFSLIDFNMNHPHFTKKSVVSLILATCGLFWIHCVNATPETDPDRARVDYASPNIGRMIYVPGGGFLRDDSSTNVSTVSEFWIGQYEITREQFTAITGLPDPSNSSAAASGENTPVQNMTWYLAIVFSNMLSRMEGLTPAYSISGSANPMDWGSFSDINEKKFNAISVSWTANGYRLPTEMEWMWAAMGADSGNKGKTNVDGHKKIFSGQSLGGSVDDYAWCRGNASGKAHGIGAKRPNELGIHDMNGNVWEWNWDWHAEIPSGILIDYKGSASGHERVLHGGSWLNDSGRCNIKFRLGHTPEFRYGNIGLRLIRH